MSDFLNSVDRVRRWTVNHALPLWAELGIDPANGGHVEALDPSGQRDAGIDYKRTRVAARQLYTFSHAAILGWGRGSEIARRLFEFMVDRMWLGADTGWLRRTTRAGLPLDTTPDLYDYSFAIFALAWYYKLSGEPEAYRIAHATLELIETRFAHAAGGYQHELPASMPRQQNPHMHLTEAALVMAEAGHSERFSDLADQLTRLFKTRIVRMPDGMLSEFFDADWKPVAGEAGEIVEPGHQMEWAWILGLHTKLTGVRHEDVIRALMSYGEQAGLIETTGLVQNAVSTRGKVLDGRSRTWPNTERIKGWISLGEVEGADTRSEVCRSITALFDNHLSHPVSGCWVDMIDPKGPAIEAAVPASTLYHVFLAFSEVMRIADVTLELPK